MLRSATFAAACLVVATLAHGAADVAPGAAPRTEYTPLKPGTYQLQAIQPVKDAVLLDERGKPVQLRAVTTGKITLLTFFYTYCVDPLGCPFARETLSKMRDRIVADPLLGKSVRFVGISCDPTTDTPNVVAQYGGALNRGSSFDWRFLTAANVPALLPVLDDLGQDVSVDVDDKGRPTRTLHHMLKVFLIDESGTVREIYTLAYLQPEVMLNDIRTLAMEANPRLTAR